MPSGALLLSQAFNGLALGSMLALVSSGLTIILGTLGVPNFAHGALFMLGAYAGFATLAQTGSFGLAILVGCGVLLLLGLFLELVLIRRFYDRPAEDQILVTFGIAILIVELVRYVFGGTAQRVPVPKWGQGIVQLGFLFYPAYRLEVVGIIAVTLLLIYLLLYRTRIGLIVRAGIEDSLMVDMLGVNVRRTFTVVFGFGVVAAGFAGVIYAPVVAVTPDMGDAFLVQSFVVVVIGGLGSFPGAIVGGIIAGEIISLTSAFNASYSDVMLYAAMALVLLARPQGLFGTEGRL